MYEITKYSDKDKSDWDDFLKKQSRIDTFLFYRDFMDYHSDRFRDYSLLIYKKGSLAAVLPGNLENDSYYSHQGLTYGGIVASPGFRTKDYFETFNIILEHLKKVGVKEFYYKPTPYIYHKVPSQEDIYALFRVGAKKVGCGISSTIDLGYRLKFSNLRKRGIKKAVKSGVKIEEANGAFDKFWIILEENLMSRYKRKPVHNLSEIVLLHNRFKENIKLYVAKFCDKVVAGVVIFVMENVVHVQYISANEAGKKMGALDAIFDTLISKYSDKFYFDFGVSTENHGHYLNESLIFQKEGFGARGVVYEEYRISI